MSGDQRHLTPGEKAVLKRSLRRSATIATNVRGSIDDMPVPQVFTEEEIAARERAARETALREAAAECDARREVYEKKLTDEAAIFAAAYETASGLILALIDEEAAR